MLGSSGQHAAVYTLLHISGPIIYYSAVSTSLLSAEPATATHNAGGVQRSSAARTQHRKNPEYWEHQTATGVSHNHPAQGWLTLGSPISQTMTFFHVICLCTVASTVLLIILGVRKLGIAQSVCFYVNFSTWGNVWETLKHSNIRLSK